MRGLQHLGKIGPFLKDASWDPVLKTILWKSTKKNTYGPAMMDIRNKWTKGFDVEIPRFLEGVGLRSDAL